MIILCNILLPNDRIHAIPTEIGKTIRPTPATDEIILVDVAAIITIVSTDSNIVFEFYNFCISFLIYGFYL